ncbi:MAG: SH3 domain-containing protein, partial [Clostridiaceae bacterium]
LSIKSGWAKVSYNGKTGYCSAEYLKKVSSEEKVEETYKTMEATTYLNVRKGPSTSHEKIGMLDPKDKVKVISISNGWAKISYKNQTAYVSSSYLKEIASKPEEEISYKIMKSTTYLNVRSGKSVTSNKIGLLSPDEKVKVISISDGWAKIYYQDGTAYCSSSYLEVVQESDGKPVKPEAPEASQKPNESDKTDSNNNAYNFYKKELNFTLDSFIEGQLTKDNVSSKGEAINKASLNKYINTDLIVERGNTFQFLKVNKFRNNMNVEELNSYLNSLKYDTFYNQGQAFINAAREYDLDALYLVAHTLLETGYGKSELARGVDYEVTVSAEDGQQAETKVVRVYNLFGIGAYDSDPLGGGAETAYKKGWTSIELAIKGGAEWIAQNYVHSSRTGQHQYTVYMMRWNTNNYISSTNNVIWHQYATDITWAESISSLMNKLSYMYENAVLDLEIPVFLTE